MIKNRINEIDFLRFVAAMAVVFFTTHSEDTLLMVCQ